MKRFLILLWFVAGPLFAQVYAVAVTSVGASYTSAPTVTATGGACTAEPTMTAVLSGSTVGSVSVTYAGVCTPGGQVPALAFTGGGGSGAAATAVMLQASIALLAAPTVTSDVNPTTNISGTNKLYRYECTLVVPAQLVPFYSSAFASGAGADRMPNTSQSSQIIWGAILGAAPLQVLYNAAFSGGILTVYDGAINVAAATPLSTVESTAVLNCSQWQTALNAWNPWVNYGTFWNGTAWAAATVL